MIGYQLIGKVELGNQLLIGDPCCSYEPGRNVRLCSAIDGTYNCYLKRGSYEEPDKREWEMVLILAGEDNDNTTMFICNNVLVNRGNMCICDYDYYENIYSHSELADVHSCIEEYDATCNDIVETSVDSKCLIFNTGIGPAWYIVSTAFDKNDNLYAIKVAFFDEEYGYNKYTPNNLSEEKTNESALFKKGAREMAAYVKQFIKGKEEEIDKLSLPFYQHLDSKRKQYASKIKTPVLIRGTGNIGWITQLCKIPLIKLSEKELGLYDMFPNDEILANSTNDNNTAIDSE